MIIPLFSSATPASGPAHERQQRRRHIDLGGGGGGRGHAARNMPCLRSTPPST